MLSSRMEVRYLTQGERVREARKKLGFTLEKFGERIGLKKNTMSAIETGRNSLTDANIKAICREFSISEEWLRTGSGNMRIPIENEAAAAVSDLVEKTNPLYDIIKGIMIAYQKLDGPSREVIDQFILDAIPPKDSPPMDPYSEAPATPEELEEKYHPVNIKKDVG